MEADIEAERKAYKAYVKDSDMMMEDTGTLDMMEVEDRSLPSGGQQQVGRSKRRRWKFHDTLLMLNEGRS